MRKSRRSRSRDTDRKKDRKRKDKDKKRKRDKEKKDKKYKKKKYDFTSIPAFTDNSSKWADGPATQKIRETKGEILEQILMREPEPIEKAEHDEMQETLQNEQSALFKDLLSSAKIDYKQETGDDESK